MLISMGMMSWYRQLVSPTQPVARPDAAQVAAEEGDADAQFALGLKHSIANGAPTNLDQAAHWYRKAADQNHAVAQFNLGMMFARGQGVPQDEAVALTWIRRSAEGGDAGAQFNLGSRYHRQSVAHDPIDASTSRIEAYKWLHLASTQGYQGAAAACERVTLGMTREEVAAGNEQVTAFTARDSASPAPSAATPL